MNIQKFNNGRTRITFEEYEDVEFVDEEESWYEKKKKEGYFGK